jgi:hypothetical protein
MKRFVKAGLAVVLLSLLAFTFVSCNTQTTPFDGKWWLGGVVGGAGYQFRGDLTFDTITIFSAVLASGTFAYDATTLTLTFSDATVSTYTYSFNAAGDQLTLDGALFIKE